MDLVTLILACSLYANPDITYAMVQIGSAGDPLTVTTEGKTTQFKTANEATRYVQEQLMHNHPIEIGLMQLPNRWIPAGVAVHDLFRPCKNLVSATEVLNQLHQRCVSAVAKNPHLTLQTCILSLYKTGNTQQGAYYAKTVLNYAKQHPFAPLKAKAQDPDMHKPRMKSNEQR